MATVPIPLRTRFTDLVGCDVPIQLAGMGWVSGLDLADAVSAAGALGMVGYPTASPPVLAGLLDAVRRRTSRPVGVNFVLPLLEDEACVDVAAERMPVVEFSYAAPVPRLVARARRGGALAAWQVGSDDEARAAADAGCDFVVVQGREAGGHVRGVRPLLPLLGDVLDAVDVPVVAAGGIGTARSLAAVLAAGAHAARVGTRFVATYESDAHPQYKQALVRAGAGDTELTTQFSAGWPDAPHRVLSSCVERARALATGVAGETVLGGVPVPVPASSPVCPLRATTGHLDAMALYAGEAVGAVSRIESALDVVRELADGAALLLGTACGGIGKESA
ncbi:NAD(P)H-dependent flavin oxidoreductase [Actinacidiphila sp. bgisy167]|uniref:NAD(P)H-dependent flavin oxidoreductase n=1 Tax=Actinacidiphila sp. bgisy167 TaxID=3413797 RepID=UPI003D73559A